MQYYHFNSGHKNYHILHDLIIEKGYYWNNITNSCIEFIKNSPICVTRNKTSFLPPPTNQILCSKPKELYVIDITELPHEFNDKKNNKIYLLSLIAHFSKYAENFLINKKDETTVINKIKLFIQNNGKPDKILTDNGKEFSNKKFQKFCKKNNILLIHGRPRHPQTQGAIERYNRTIKDILKYIFIEKQNNNEAFNINKELKTAISMYNNTKHSTIGASPISIFNSNDDELFEKIKLLTKKSQKYKKNTIYKIIEDEYGLLCEHFKLSGNKIKRNSLAKKGRYSIPIIIKGCGSSNEYKVYISIEHEILIKNKVYFAEYTLLKLCDKNTWSYMIKTYLKS